jgi:antitoxin (DNA-binding transcriptional repressor) of toxin-antitoxin stability system
MAIVTVQELRSRPEELIARIVAGETMTMTRDGHAVAELRPVARSALTADELLERWRGMPPVDAVTFWRDVRVAPDAEL